MSPCPDRRSCRCLRSRLPPCLLELHRSSVTLPRRVMPECRLCSFPAFPCGHEASRLGCSGQKAGRFRCTHARKKAVVLVLDLSPFFRRRGRKSPLYRGGWRAEPVRSELAPCRWQDASSPASEGSPGGRKAAQRCLAAEPRQSVAAGCAEPPPVPTPEPDPGAGRGRKRFNGDLVALGVLIA